MKHDNIKKKNVIKEVKDDLKKMVSNQKKREKVDSNIVSNLLLGGVIIIIIFGQHDTIEEFEKRLQEVEHEPLPTKPGLNCLKIGCFSRMKLFP